MSSILSGHNRTNYCGDRDDSIFARGSRKSGERVSEGEGQYCDIIKKNGLPHRVHYRVHKNKSRGESLAFDVVYGEFESRCPLQILNSK
jgi:hypothetical protein